MSSPCRTQLGWSSVFPVWAARWFSRKTPWYQTKFLLHGFSEVLPHFPHASPQSQLRLPSSMSIGSLQLPLYLTIACAGRPFSYVKWLPCVHHGGRGLPPLEALMTLRAQLSAAASAMEALNIDHCGLMPRLQEWQKCSASVGVEDHLDKNLL